MIFRDSDHIEAVASRPAVIFFAQRMEELTYDYSLDSHKAPTVNVPSLIQEALEQLETVQSSGGAVPVGTVDQILDELRVRISSNIIVNEMISHERDVHSKIRSDNPQLYYLLKVLKRELSNYSYVTTAMSLIIKSIEENEKDKIDFLTRELVTSLQNHGMSRAHLYFSNKKFFFDKKSRVESIGDVREFLRMIFPHLHHFKIALKINAPEPLLKIGTEHFATFGLELNDDPRDEFDNFDPTNSYFTLKRGQTFLICDDIQGYDRFSAISQAVDKANLVKNILHFFQHADSFIINDKVLVEQCCEDEVFLCSRHYNRMHQVEDERPLKAGSQVRRLLQDTRLIRGSDASRFLSVADFHGMALGSPSVENQLVNIWIALETISPSRSNHSKIDNVITAIAPITGITYAHRLIRRLSVDAFFWNRKLMRESLADVDDLGDKAFEKILAVVTLKKHEHKLAEIFAKMGDFELLRNRFYKSWLLFSDPRKFVEQLDAHQQRVSWQLRRIYRARNSIVHLGKRPSYTEGLVDNAHEYLDQAISLTNRISMGDTGFYTYKECFDFLSWEFEVYRRRIAAVSEFNESTAQSLIWSRSGAPTRESLLRPQE